MGKRIYNLEFFKKLANRKMVNDNNIVTEEILEKLNIKTYKNGSDIKVGDKILYALLSNLLVEEIKSINYFSELPMERDNTSTKHTLELIALNENHFDLYKYDERFQDINGLESGKSLPIIHLI